MRNPTHRLAWALICAGLSIILARPAHAEPTTKAGSENVSFLALHSHWFSGGLDKSLTGSKGYILQFSSESLGDYFRTNYAADFLFASGEVSLNSTPLSCLMIGGFFSPGINVFPTPGSTFSPYVGASGVVGWGLMQLAQPPAAVGVHTQSLTYGYELRAGINWRTSSGRHYRLQTSLFSATGKFASTGGVLLDGLRMGFGINF